MNTFYINLQDFLNPYDISLINKTNGYQIKLMMECNKIFFDDILLNYNSITFLLPDNIIAVNKSFLQGLFQNFIQESNISKSDFINKFQFQSNYKNLLTKIYDNINFLF